MAKRGAKNKEALELIELHKDLNQFDESITEYYCDIDQDETEELDFEYQDYVLEDRECDEEY